MSSPYIKLWKIHQDTDYPIIVPGSVKRDWMDKTYNKIAYYCAPIGNANMHGWELRLTHDVLVKWQGTIDGDVEQNPKVDILSGEYYNGRKTVTIESGVGQVSFLFRMTAETDPDHYIILSGPPNYLFPDAEPLTAIFRTDFCNYQELSLAWKLTTENKEILFPKDMPVAFLTIYPKNLLESTEITIHNFNENKELKDNVRKYQEKRSEHFQKNGIYDFPLLYRHGIGPNGEKFLDKPFKPTLKTPRTEL